MAQREMRAGPADRAALSEATSVWLHALLDYERARDRSMARLFGRTMPRNPLRDELLRLVMLDFTEGRTRTIAAYQRECQRQHVGSASSVVHMIRNLAEMGMLALEPHPSDLRAICVHATRRLVSFYATFLPQLSDAAKEAAAAAQKTVRMRIKSK